MKKVQKYGMLLCLLVATACNRNDVENVKFQVNIENGTASLRAGEPVTFVFDGNAEYIAFFSGESGNCYANINRDSVGVASLKMATTIKQQYTDTEYRQKEIVHAYISQDFDGDYTLTGINKANWQKISGNGYNQLDVPLTEKSATDQVSDEIDLDTYKSRPFYVAFQYNAFKRTDVPASSGGGRYVVQPRIDINPLTLSKTTVEGEEVVWDNPSTEWAFQVVYEKSTQSSSYSINDGGLLFQPQQGKEHTYDDVIVWMISKQMRPWEVEPDRGTPIKTLGANLPSYSHVYNEPGQYTATFIATNANLWDSSQVVKEITFTINP